MDYQKPINAGAEDMTKKSVAWEAGEIYCLRDCGAVLIYATDAPGNFPIHGRFLDVQESHQSAWTRDGRWSGSDLEKDSHNLDLTIIHKV